MNFLHLFRVSGRTIFLEKAANFIRVERKLFVIVALTAWLPDFSKREPFKSALAKVLWYC